MTKFTGILSSKYNTYYHTIALLIKGLINRKSSLIYICVMPIVFLELIHLFYQPAGDFPPSQKAIISSYMTILATTAVIGMTILSTSLNYLTYRIVEFKQSSLFSRISLSPLSKADIIIAIALYTCILCFFQTIWTIIFSVILFSGDWTNHYDGIVAGVKSFQLFYALGAILIYVFFAASLGTFIASISRSTNVANMLGFVLYFIFTFLSGQFLSPEMIGTFPKWLKVISDLLPTTYTQKILSSSFFPKGQGSNIKHFLPKNSSWYQVQWWGYIYPITFSVVILIISFYFSNAEQTR